MLERKSSLGKKVVKILAGGKVLKLEDIHADKCWGKPRDLGQQHQWLVIMSRDTVQPNMTLCPVFPDHQTPPCREGKSRPTQCTAGGRECETKSGRVEALIPLVLK